MLQQGQQVYASPVNAFGTNLGGGIAGMGRAMASGATTGMGMNAAGGQQQFGAHEVLMVHEVLQDTIDGLNKFELYRSHVKDSQLARILDNQIQFMRTCYQNTVNYLHHKGQSSAVPYRIPRTSSPAYGLRNPQPQEPNTSVNQMDDRDVASGMLGSAKWSAVLHTQAALECADPTLRAMMVSGAQSCINKAYELFQFMNQRGMYQVPTLADKTTNTFIHSYQSPQGMGMQMQMQ
ncbi:spore coat protein [Heliobacterium gestii]|uniref:Spore coat protein n=1 Tax=Heliomicrobium gestii TaxID=2699 RepID=A0A845L910_HELGE|nr:spore coat protein [Heliomicrobium gestii]MBM7865472.1 spore coat protein CotF [Heliomicrobium gestii]MZP41724.1 spore coat protein [Heliomicrobium gestii]